MKFGFYPKLAWDGIRKNQRVYFPYIITCVGMVMMHYIISFLSSTPVLETMPGGETIGGMLAIGGWIMAFFAALFLFYSNSFLIRRRKKEFGLYNILGMGKWNISKVLFWESLIVAVISLVTGLAIGVGLSKLFELGLVNLMTGEVSYDFVVFPDTMSTTSMIFACIFALLFLNSLRQISLSNPIALIRSENTGEKPPKANWLLGIGGAAILAAAYYIAVTIQDPITALGVFFVAVVMVIAATYLLFIAGSVVLCRILQKNKGYYYKANHFVSVSSMAYRMKRNGAGLASICILLTMVLVMISSTSALYFGIEDSLANRYPRDITVDLTMVDVKDVSDENVAQFRSRIQEILDEKGVQPQNLYDYRSSSVAGLLTNGFFQMDVTAITNFGLETYANVVQLYYVPLEDYNRLTGQSQTLAQDEVLISAYRIDYAAPTFQAAGGETYKVKAIVDEFVGDGNSAMSMIPSVYVVVSDFEAAVGYLQSMADFTGEQMSQVRWSYGFDLDLPAEEQIEIYRQIRDTDWGRGLENDELVYSGNVECLENNRGDFYGTFGGLFFLGIMLSIVFLAAAVLIIYYKQISEGYEDQARFEIMQKVGMTKREIRRSINSQILTVFFLPLVTAGIHLCFAFPIVRKLLLLFNLWDTELLIISTVVCFLIFGVFYAVVYRITSNAYFAIVSGAREE